MEISSKVLKSGYKLCSVNEFRTKYAGGVSSHAIDYACKNDKLDYMDISPRLKVIVLTKKSLSYSPNKSKKRSVMQTGK